MLVADGNFKADHVKQKQTGDPDVWLSNGGGMQPNNEEYMAFLKDAFEKHTVCKFLRAIVVMPRPLTIWTFLC